MLWDASAINGYAIDGSDGRVGTVADLLFDDIGWIVRWLVVDTGNWLSGRKVLLPLSVLGNPDRALRRFPIKATMQQVRDSPDVDTDQPVSRQAEARVHDYFGWNPYWSGSPLPVRNTIAAPVGAQLCEVGPDPRELVRVDAQSTEGEPHLRSVATVIGYYIRASDGEIGHVEDFLVDDVRWNIRCIKVDTKNWWPGQHVLISPFSVREIDWAGKLVHLNVDRQRVKDAPPYDPSITVDGAYEEKFLTYYGIRWVTA